ncbi:MAG TPA: hypothetical protein VED00_00720 [archaeon]|nr:hypothetical protein [archaeon]
MDDLQNLGNIISKQIISGFTTVIRLSLDEYEKLDVRIGDKISLDINKIPVGVP